MNGGKRKPIMVITIGLRHDPKKYLRQFKTK